MEQSVSKYIFIIYVQTKLLINSNKMNQINNEFLII